MPFLLALASMMEVMPKPLAILSAPFRPFCHSSGVNSGKCSETKSIALSLSVPEGSPVFGFLSMRPSLGSGVFLVIPAISNALELIQAECPSEEFM